MRALALLLSTTHARQTTAACAHPPLFTSVTWPSAPRDWHTATEFLGFASRTSDADIVVGFNTKLLNPRNKFGGHHHEFSRLDVHTYAEVAGLSFEASPAHLDHAVLTSAPSRDRHQHSLVVHLPIPAPTTGAPERFTITARTKTGAVWVAYQDVAVCDERHDEPVAPLAVCTQLLGRDLEAAPEHVATWLGYHFAQGVTRATLYVDVPPAAPTAGGDAVTRLLGADANRTTFVPWRFAEKDFVTQQLAESHCVYTHRGRATWVLSSDVDEWPVPDNGLLVDRVRAVFKPRTSWWEVPATICESPGAGAPPWAATTCRGRSPPKPILNPNNVDYMSVHMVTTPRPGRPRAGPRTGGVAISHVQHHLWDASLPAPRTTGCLPPRARAAWDAYAAHAAAMGYGAAARPGPAAASPSNDTAPLRAGWREYTVAAGDGAGRTAYYNEKTRATVWNRPTARTSPGAAPCWDLQRSTRSPRPCASADGRAPALPPVCGS